MTDRRSLDCMFLGRTVRILIAICTAALGGCWSPQPAAPPTPAKTSVPSTDFDAAIDELLELMRKRLLAQLSKLATFGQLQVKLDVKQRADAVLYGNGIDDVVRRAAIRPLLDDSLE